MQYNPLIKEEPDINLNPEDRPIGGLGIFLVKNYANECHYDYRDGKNILTVKVFLEEN